MRITRYTRIALLKQNKDTARKLTSIMENIGIISPHRPINIRLIASSISTNHIKKAWTLTSGDKYLIRNTANHSSQLHIARQNQIPRTRPLRLISIQLDTQVVDATHQQPRTHSYAIPSCLLKNNPRNSSWTWSLQLHPSHRLTQKRSLFFNQVQIIRL